MGGVFDALRQRAENRVAQTRNPAGYMETLGELSREQGRQAKETGLDVEKYLGGEGYRRRMGALGGIQGIYGLDTGALERGMGTEAGMAEKLAEIRSRPGFLQQLALAAMSGGAQVGSAALGKPPCWVAAAVYGGWDDPRVDLVRQWIFGIWARQSIVGWAISRLYILVGRPVACLVRHHAGLRRVFRRLFDAVISKMP